MDPRGAGGVGGYPNKYTSKLSARCADHFQVHLMEIFRRKFRLCHFVAQFLSQDWSSDCHFVKALSWEPLSLTPSPWGKRA